MKSIRNGSGRNQLGREKCELVLAQSLLHCLCSLVHLPICRHRPPLELALAPLHLHRAHAGALECRHAARDKQERSDEAKVRAWALREPEPSLPSLPLSSRMRLPMDDEVLNCCIVVPPALDIEKRLLHAYDKLKNAAPEKRLLGARLYETWGARHDMLRSRWIRNVATGWNLVKKSAMVSLVLT